MSLELVQNTDPLDLDDSHSKYTKEQKIRVVGLFLSGSTLSEAAKAEGIPQQTVDNWKNNSVWWNEVIHDIRKNKQDELDNLLTKTIHSALEKINDRLEYGDYQFDSKSGDLVRIPPKAREIASVLTVIYDKRALIRGEATSIRTDSATSLQSLEDKFKKFALHLKEKDVTPTEQAIIERID